MPELCRVDYLRSDGTWGVGHGGCSLLNPEKYAKGLGKNGIFAKVTVLGGPRLEETEVFYSFEGAELL